MILVRFVDTNGDGLGEFPMKAYVPFGDYIRYEIGGVVYEPVSQRITPLNSHESDFEAKQTIVIQEQL